MSCETSRPLFSFKRKSGTTRPSAHGVKTRRGNRIYLDVPGPGVRLLIDDIQQLIVTQGTGFEKNPSASQRLRLIVTQGTGFFPNQYRIEGFPDECRIT